MTALSNGSRVNRRGLTGLFLSLREDTNQKSVRYRQPMGLEFKLLAGKFQNSLSRKKKGFGILPGYVVIFVT